jgi:hypothetical protein
VILAGVYIYSEKGSTLELDVLLSSTVLMSTKIKNVSDHRLCWYGVVALFALGLAECFLLLMSSEIKNV